MCTYLRLKRIIEEKTIFSARKRCRVGPHCAVVGGRLLRVLRRYGRKKRSVVSNLVRQLVPTVTEIEGHHHCMRCKNDILTISTYVDKMESDTQMEDKDG
jgi:hypothetical protein